MQDKDLEFLYNILFKYEADRIATAKERKFKFSHYTSAEAAISIINTKTFWLRNCKSMNDYSEVKYGESVLMDIWNNSEIGSNFKKTLKEINGDLPERITKKLNEHKDHRLHLSYILSLSERRNNKSEKTTADYQCGELMEETQMFH